MLRFKRNYYKFDQSQKFQIFLTDAAARLGNINKSVRVKNISLHQMPEAPLLILEKFQKVPASDIREKLGSKTPFR